MGSRNFKTGCTLHHNMLQIIMFICFYTFFQAVSSFSFHSTATLSYTSTSAKTTINTAPCIRFPLKSLRTKVIDSPIKSTQSHGRTPSKLNYSSGSSAVVLPIVRNVIGKAQTFLQNDPTYVLAAIVSEK